MEFPESVGGVIDLLFDIQQRRIELERQVRDIKAREAAIKSHLLSSFERDGLTGARGIHGKASYSTDPMGGVKVIDWPTYLRWAVENGNWESVQKRPTITTLRERWENGEYPPGVEPVETGTLTVGRA